MKKRYLFIALALLVSLFTARMPLAQEGDFDGPIHVSSLHGGVANGTAYQTVSDYRVKPGMTEYEPLVTLLCGTKCRLGLQTFFMSPYRGIGKIDALYYIDTRPYSGFAAYDRDHDLVAINGTFYSVDQSFFSQLEEILSTIPKI